MSAVTIECRTIGIDGTEEWIMVGHVRPTDQPGSVTSHTPDGRDVFMFGWWEGKPGVWRSIGGVDEADPYVRTIASLGFDQLADLRQGEYVLPIVTENAGPMDVQFRLVES